MRSHFQLTLVFLFIHSRLSHQATTSDCDKTFALHSSDGVYLKNICEIKREFSHNHAGNLCRKLDMNLLAIGSKEEFEALDSYLREQSIFASMPAVWTERNGIRVNGVRDADGKWFTHMAEEKQPLFEGIPFLESARQQEPCLVLRRDTTFKATGHRCSQRYPIICEYKTTETTTANPLAEHIERLNGKITQLQENLSEMTNNYENSKRNFEKMSRELHEKTQHYEMAVDIINSLNASLAECRTSEIDEWQIQQLREEAVKIKECRLDVANLQIILSEFSRTLETHVEVVNANTFLKTFRQRTDSQLSHRKTAEKFVCAAGGVEQCVVTEMNVLDSNEKVGIVERYQETNMNTKQIKKFLIESKTMWFVPHHFNSFFSELTELTITDSQLIMVRAFDLRGMESLTRLVLSRNELTTISREALISLTRLTFLDLSYNKIDRIDHDTFSVLVNLIEIRLNHNHIAAIKSNIFESNVRLQEVWLQQNFIREISLKFVQAMDNFALVDLRSNNCTDLVYRRGMQNNMETLMQSCASGLILQCDISNLNKCAALALTIRQERMKIIEAVDVNQSGHELNGSAINELAIRGGEMFFMPLGIDEIFESLTTIIIKNTKLTKISRNDFSSIANLQSLVANKNDISAIEADSFKGNSQLETINLSHNKLTTLPERIFADLPSLKTLILSHNLFTELYMNAIDCPTSITHFDFSNNQETTSVQANIVNICLKDAEFVDFSNVKCLRIENYKIETINKKKTKYPEEMFGLLYLNCRF